MCVTPSGQMAIQGPAQFGAPTAMVGGSLDAVLIQTKRTVALVSGT
jgi:hypothetical protein